MAGGFTRDGAVQEQIDASIDDAIKDARNRLPAGESSTHCIECEEPIPQARREALPGVRLCITCQNTRDGQHRVASCYNRRGSKDSQLR